MKIARIGLLILMTFSLSVLVAACNGAAFEAPAPSQPGPTPTLAPAGTPGSETGQPASDEGAENKDTVFGDILVTQTPEPTATPDRVAQGVSRFTQAIGLTRESFLGLAADDWINLGISLVYILIAFAIGRLLSLGLLRWVAHRTSAQLGDALVEAIGSRLRWLVVILVLGVATARLTFLSAELKIFLEDIYFTLSIILSSLILWSLISLGHDWYRERLKEAGRVEDLDPFLVLLTRLGHIVLVIVALSILLARFGINVTALVAALGIGGLALSLAAQDTLADAIAGFIILADRPYRVGDRIEIQGADTWGDVIDIGLRTTRIRTRDNRMIIVPNSLISKNQIVNYTYPDPRYRIETRLGVAYGTDIETARRVIVEAVRGVTGVLSNKPVEALYVDMGDSAMIFLVRWWIESYGDTRRVYDGAHTALQRALDAAGIKMPYPTQSLLLQVEPGEGEQLSRPFHASSQPDSSPWESHGSENK